MGTERCRELNTTFCRRFLPPQAPTGHALLLDWDGRIAYTPEAADLHRCLTDYAALVEEATREDPCDLLNVRDASEVALAYLYRGLDAGRPLPETANLGRLTLLLRRVLRASADWFGPTRWNDEMKWYDGFKVPDAIVSLLETLAESDAFRRRFLPAGTPDAHSLLMDFQHEVAFTPSAAELQQCLEAYTALMRTATRVTCMPVRWCVAGQRAGPGLPVAGAATGRAPAGASHLKRPDPAPPQDAGRRRDRSSGRCAGTTGSSASTSWRGCWKNTRRRACRAGTSSGPGCGRRCGSGKGQPRRLR